jgi:hypothetical protein
MNAQPMTDQTIARNNALVFFVFWLAVLLAGADRPPPRAFLWIVLVIALCAAVVYWRIPTYLAWARSRQNGRFWRVALDGLAAGLVVALPFALQGSGEPGVTMRPVDYLLWFAVLGLLGVLNAEALYAINALLDRRRAAS